jgi:hypothetical protein
LRVLWDKYVNYCPEYGISTLNIEAIASFEAFMASQTKGSNLHRKRKCLLSAKSNYGNNLY